MIKHTIIAGAVMALASTSALADSHTTKDATTKNNWDVSAFGEIRAFAQGSSKKDVDTEVKSSDTKFGFKVNGQQGPVGIFGELSADVDVNGDGTDDLTTRFGYVGVSLPKFGSVSLGKQMSIQEGFVDKADKFYSAGNNSVQKMSFYQSNSIKYTNTIGRVDVGALAAMTNDDADNDALDRYQIGASFMNVGVSLGKDNTTDTTFYGIGYSDKFGKIGVGASYTIKDVAGDAGIGKAITWDSDKTTTVTRGIELAVSYDVSDAITATGGYNKTDVAGDDGNAIGEVAYKISSNVVAFGNVEYDIDSSDHTTRAGISITF